MRSLRRRSQSFTAAILFSRLAFLCPANAVAQPGPDTSHSDAVPNAQTQEQLHLAGLNLRRLEEVVQARDPKLRQVERLRQQLSEKQSATDPRRDLVFKYLTAQEKERPDVQKEYRSLIYAWSGHVYTTFVSDPDKAALLQDALVVSPERMRRRADELKRSFPDLADEPLDDPAVLWKAYQEKSPKMQQISADAFARLAKKAKFPQAVVEQAKREGATLALQSLYDSYISFHTPSELVNARTKSAQLRARLEDERRDSHAGRDREGTLR